MGVDDLRREYPELEGVELTPVDVIDDGERLDAVPGDSLDFIVANHFIEHTEDPIGTIARHLAKLRPGGILFLAVPDKRHTFDSGRELTELAHLLGDYRGGPESSRDDHYLEFARYFKGLDGPEAQTEALRVKESGYSIHFHVWTLESFCELLACMQSDLDLPFAVEAVEPNHHEFIAILRKRPTLPAV